MSGLYYPRGVLPNCGKPRVSARPFWMRLWVETTVEVEPCPREDCELWDCGRWDARAWSEPRPSLADILSKLADAGLETKIEIASCTLPANRDPFPTCFAGGLVVRIAHRSSVNSVPTARKGVIAADLDGLGRSQATPSSALRKETRAWHSVRSVELN
jgi:hypothetical protein